MILKFSGVGRSDFIDIGAVVAGAVVDSAILDVTNSSMVGMEAPFTELN